MRSIKRPSVLAVMFVLAVGAHLSPRSRNPLSISYLTAADALKSEGNNRGARMV
jgi:hypothetical protein